MRRDEGFNPSKMSGDLGSGPENGKNKSELYVPVKRSVTAW